jgi:hypothetical protein
MMPYRMMSLSMGNWDLDIPQVSRFSGVTLMVRKYPRASLTTPEEIPPILTIPTLLLD